MRKLVVASTVAIVAVSAFAQLMRPMSDKLLKATGGRIVQPNTQKGEIAYVNCQSAAKREWLQESVDNFLRMTQLNVTLKDGKFDLRNPVIVGNLSIFIVDEADYPISLIAPEARWGMVNVAKLKTDQENFFRARVKKEISRVFAMLCGGYKSSYPGNLTDAIVKVEELDTHMNDSLPVDVLGRFQLYLEPYGIRPATISTYRNACLQGWAPAPTNEYQKAIWDKVHELPKNPMQIKFDPKKDK